MIPMALLAIPSLEPALIMIVEVMMILIMTMMVMIVPPGYTRAISSLIHLLELEEVNGVTSCHCQ